MPRRVGPRAGPGRVAVFLSVRPGPPGRNQLGDRVQVIGRPRYRAVRAAAGRAGGCVRRRTCRGALPPAIRNGRAVVPGCLSRPGTSGCGAPGRGVPGPGPGVPGRRPGRGAPRAGVCRRPGPRRRCGRSLARARCRPRGNGGRPTRRPADGGAGASRGPRRAPGGGRRGYPGRGRVGVPSARLRREACRPGRPGWPGDGHGPGTGETAALRPAAGGTRRPGRRSCPVPVRARAPPAARSPRGPPARRRVRAGPRPPGRRPPPGPGAAGVPPRRSAAGRRAARTGTGAAAARQCRPGGRLRRREPGIRAPAS